MSYGSRYVALDSGSLLKLQKSSQTHAFVSDRGYKAFVEKDLELGTSNLAKRLLEDFENAEKQPLLEAMSNEQLSSRFVAQFSINQLYEVLVSNDINSAEKLRAQLN